MSWLGSVVSGASSIRQGDIDKDNAKRQEELGEHQAQDATRRGTIEEMRYRRQIAQLIGAQKNEIGARNVEARGSALDLLQDSAQVGEEDITTLRNEVAREAWGYRVNANEQSRFHRSQSANNRAQGAASALTAGAQAYGQWKSE